MSNLIYQEKIIDTITEFSPLEDVDKNIKYFVKSIWKYFKRISSDINYTYIIGLLANEENKVVFYTLKPNPIFDIEDCSSCIIYNIVNVNNNVICYILALTTATKYRNQGYARKILNEFAVDIKEKYKESNNIKFMLSSTDDAFIFYEKNDFVLLEDDLVDHPVLIKHEKYDKKKLYYIFEREL